MVVQSVQKTVGGVGDMSAKEYLQQAMKLDRLIRSKTEQLERLESLATSAPQSFGEEGPPSAHDDTKGSKLENQVVSIVDLKEQMKKKTAELVQSRAEITSVIEGVNNLTLQFVLEERYLNYKTWDMIADQTGFSKDYLYRLHSEGLRLVECVLSHR